PYGRAPGGRPTRPALGSRARASRSVGRCDRTPRQPRSAVEPPASPPAELATAPVPAELPPHACRWCRPQAAVVAGPLHPQQGPLLGGQCSVVLATLFHSRPAVF